MRRPWKISSLLMSVAVLTVLFGCLAHPKSVTAANPTTMSFQGKVVNANGTNVTDGTYGFVFKLYTVSTAGTAIWTETQSSVTVTAGVFQVNLGSVCPFFTANACNGSTPIDFNANPNLYLGITFNSDPAGEMTPRVQLQSVPFAFQADNASKLGGLAASNYVQLSPASQQSGNINISGTGTLASGLTVTTGGATIGGTLSVTSSAAGSNAGLLQGAASATVPTLVLKAGVTPGAAADILQFQSSSAVLGGVQNDGVLNLAGSAGTIQYQNAITALGDKLSLYSSSTFGRYGFGIQANTLVAHIGASSAAFAIKVDPGSGQASSAALSVFSVTGGGIVTVGNTSLAGILQSASGQNLTVRSQGAGQLILDSANGTLGLGTNTATIQRTAATGLSLDLNDGGLTTLTLKNTGAGVANLNLFDGSLQTGSTPTTRLDNAGNLTNIGTIGAASGTFNVNASGDQTAVFVQLDGSSTANGGSGLGTSTTLTLASAANFDVGNYVQISDANCGGTGVNPCYAKITAKATNTLTITPALRWTNTAAVLEFHVPELGGTDLTQTLANRYGRGYFIAGVATGNGTTFYNEDGIVSTLTSFDLLNTTVATLNIGGAATTLNIGSASTTTNFLGGITLTNSGGLNAGNGLIQGTGGLTITGTTSLTGTTNINTSGSATTTLGNASGAINLQGATTLSNSFSQTGANTFSSGSGAISLNGDTTVTGSKTLTVGTGLTTLGGGLNVTGNIATTNGNILIQQTAAGASAIFDDVAGKIGSLKAGSAKIAFLFDNTGNFSIGSDTRTNIAASNTPGTDVLTILGASGNVGLGDTTPAATLTVGNGDLFQVAGASGNVLTAGTVTGTTINGTTGINTGATAGTQRIDSSGNLVNIGNLTATGTLTVSTTGSTGVNFTDGTNSLVKVIDANVSGVNYGILQIGAKASTGNEAAQCAAAGDVGKIYVNSTDKAVFACTAANAWEQLDNGRANQLSTAGAFAATTTDTIVDSLAITPTSANSDIWINYDASIALNCTGLGCNQPTVVVRLLRGTTCAAGTLIQSSTYVGAITTSNYPLTFNHVDLTPTNGASNTYIICAQRTAGSGTITNNISARDMTLREIDTSGADYAEIYFSRNGDIEPGTVIVSDPGIKAGVQVSKSRYQKGIVGVVSTQPGQVLSDGSNSGTPVTVALAGRVPVRVSDENGPIHAGDSLTSSSTSGVAMKATKAGAVIGTALTEFTSQGDGEVMLLVSTGQTAGTLPLTVDNQQQDSQSLLSDLVAGRAEVAKSVDLSSIFTDRLAAAVEIVTPKVVADTVETNNIVIGDKGISFTDTTGRVVASIDTVGGFHTVPATSSLASTDGSAQTDTAQNTSPNTDGMPVTVPDNASTNLNLASASISGGLNVGGDANFAGLSTFQKLATFLAKTVFRQDVEFQGHLTVAADTAGYASLRAGETTVHVKFTAPYDNPPVVTTADTDGQFIGNTVNNITEKGFDISIAAAADQDIKFSWTAVGVTNPQTATNPLPTTE